MIVSQIINEFETDTTSEWRDRVNKELKGYSYQDYLVWESLDGFSIESWQNSRPQTLPTLSKPLKSWQIVEPIYASDVLDANKLAHQSLMSGAEAIWYFKPFLGAAAEIAVKGIDTIVAPVFIQGGNCIDVYRPLLKYGQEVQLSQDQMVYLNGKRLRERGASVIDEIAMLLAQAIEVSQVNGFKSKVLFGISCGAAFLTEIAKTRALRWLWNCILLQEGQANAEHLIMASNLAITYTKNDEHSNILRATSSAMSAVLGGANFVMIEPWDRDWRSRNDFSTRISRNIQTLMKDEAKLDKNLNSADGSYFLENLTVSLAEHAWAKTQDILSKGGFTKYAESGELKGDLKQHAEKIKSAYSSKKHVVIGINAFSSKEGFSEAVDKVDDYKLLPEMLHLPSYLQSQNTV